MLSRSRAVLLVLGLIVAAAAAYASLSLRQVPAVAERAAAAWGGVESEFKERAELVPDIVAVVRSLSGSHAELIARLKETATGVSARPADPRAPYSLDRFKAFMATQDALSETLGEVMDLLDPQQRARPEVKAALMRLEASENRIVIARSDYTDAARAYNEARRRIPNRWTVPVLYPDATPMVASFDLKHDAKKWTPLFGSHHAQVESIVESINFSAIGRVHPLQVDLARP